MKRIVGLASAAVLTATVLAGCSSGSGGGALGGVGGPSAAGGPSSANGGSTSSGGADSGAGIVPSGSYCNDIKAAAARLADINGSNLGGLNLPAITTTLQIVAAEAPSDIKGSWMLLTGQFAALQKDITSAGLSMSDFAKLSQGQTAHLNPAKLRALETKLQSFDTSGVTAAANKIQAQVKSDCGIDLNSSKPSN